MQAAAVPCESRSLAGPTPQPCNFKDPRAENPQPAVSEQPHLGVDIEGQDQESEQQVGDGEADDEVVGGGFQRPLRADTEANQPVAAHDEQDEDDAQHQGGDVVAARRWQRGAVGGRGPGAAVPQGAAVPHGAAALPRQPGAWEFPGRGVPARLPPPPAALGPAATLRPPAGPKLSAERGGASAARPEAAPPGSGPRRSNWVTKRLMGRWRGGDTGSQCPGPAEPRGTAAAGDPDPR